MTARKLSRSSRAYVMRAVRLAKRRSDGVISSGEVAYATCHGVEASALDFEAAAALRASRKFRPIGGAGQHGVHLFRLEG